jgi:hypothetical protein
MRFFFAGEQGRAPGPFRGAGPILGLACSGGLSAKRLGAFAAAGPLTQDAVRPCDEKRARGVKMRRRMPEPVADEKAAQSTTEYVFQRLNATVDSTAVKARRTG